MNKLEVLQNLITKSNAEAAGLGLELTGQDVATEWANLLFDDGSIMEAAQRYDVKGNNNRIKVPALTDPLQFGQGTTPVGTRAYFTGQSNPLTASSMQMAGIPIALSSLTTLIQASRELAMDVSNFDAKFDEASTQASRKAISWSMIFGHGVSVQGVGYLGDGQGATLTTPFSATPTAAELRRLTSCSTRRRSPVPGGSSAKRYTPHCRTAPTSALTGYTDTLPSTACPSSSIPIWA